MSAMDLLQMNRQLTDNPLYVYNSNGDRFDISAEPYIDTPELSDILSSNDISRNDKSFSRYMYNGVRVPRVTSVLDYCKGDTSSLMKYAANLGYKYYKESQRILDIGTHVHEAIAEYLTSGTIYCIKNIREGREEVYNCLKNFIAWYNHVTLDLGWKVEIFVSEVPLICPWFGGTTDAIMNINGRRYIVDFKSSKKISKDYFIQASAYKWIIDHYYPEYTPIHGIGILRFDKYNDTYEDIFFDISDINDYNYISQCQQMFGLALEMFYMSNMMTNKTDRLCKEKRESNNKGIISKSLKKAPVKHRKRGKKVDVGPT